MTMNTENQNIVNQNQMNIMNLPDELLYMITEKLQDVNHVVSLSMVNKRFNNIAKTCDMSEFYFYDISKSMRIVYQYPNERVRRSINYFRSNDITKKIRTIHRFNRTMNLHMDLYDEYICPKMSYPKMFKQKNYEEFAKYCNFLKITAYNENLYNLEKFTNIKRLELEGLGIEEIPVLPNLKDLAIENCMSIRNIPYMPKLRIIRPLHCHNLRNIEVKECSSEEMYILIGQCPKIEINNLYNIKYLSLYDLDHVTDIPINFKNNSLNLVHMNNLKSISYMIKNLRVRQCKEIDESIIMNLTKFGVNIESFKSYPQII